MLENYWGAMKRVLKAFMWYMAVLKLLPPFADSWQAHPGFCSIIGTAPFPHRPCRPVQAVVPPGVLRQT